MLTVEEIQKKLFSFKKDVQQIQKIYDRYGVIPPERLSEAIDRFQRLRTEIESEYLQMKEKSNAGQLSDEEGLHYWPAIRSAYHTCVNVTIGTRTEQLQSVLFDIQSAIEFFYPKTD